MKEDSFTPFVPAEKRIPETTVQAVLLGLILGLIMTAANTYLGLYAGMTVSASIPAAVISMGILRGILKRGTILENNIVQTIASAGESLAAGIIFTVPALVLTGSWHNFRYWPVTLIAAFGGILGVLFMIPLRRALIVEEKELIYPEGLACAEVLEAGEERGSGMRIIFSAMGLGILFKGLVGAVSIVKGTVEGAVRLGNTLFYAGCDMSPALIGVGFIVGPNVATLVFLGGAIGWVIGIPVYAAIHGIPEGITMVDYASNLWDTQIRYMGVGAMVVGGIWSIISVRHGIVKGVTGGLAGVGKGAGAAAEKRTDRNISSRQIGLLLLLTLPFLFGLYIHLTGGASIGIVAGVVLTISAFFFVAVSSYIVGLVGSSNNPVSGMTICTVLLASGILLLLGMSGTAGIIAVLGIAGVTCCAACTAGDVSQDLKTGYLVGASPFKQQWTQILGVVVPAFIIAPILTVLHTAYGIGDQLRAPQATLFASITETLFHGGNLPGGMIVTGATIGIGIILIDSILKAKGSTFRTYIMPVAVGIYLPLALSTPIFLGGIISMLVAHSVKNRGEDARRDAQGRGLLFSSGLVAGEAITGILLAFLIVLKIELPIEVFDSDLISLLLLAVVLFTLIRLARGRQ